MYWLARPPILRRALAIVLLAGAVVVALRRPPTVDFPFAALDIAAGEAVSSGMIELRPIPAGFLPPSNPIGGRALVPIAAGRPLTEEVLSHATAVPVGWWALELPVPAGLTAGSRVQVVISPIQSEAVVSVPGVATASGGDNELGESTAMVAVPGAQAALVAVAARDSRVTVLVGAAGS
jgi:hypothetical protein